MMLLFLHLLTSYFFRQNLENLESGNSLEINIGGIRIPYKNILI